MANWQTVYANKTGKPAYCQSSNRFKHDYVGFLEGELDKLMKENLKPTTNTPSVEIRNFATCALQYFKKGMPKKAEICVKKLDSLLRTLA